jgi:hypothetical protein
MFSIFEIKYQDMTRIQDLIPFIPDLCHKNNLTLRGGKLVL